MRFAWIAEPPFTFVGANGLIGCDVELARLAFAELGEAFEPVETEFAQLLDGLGDGRWDLTAGMFITQERAKRASFANRSGRCATDCSSLNTMPVPSVASSIGGYLSLAQRGGKLAVLEGQIQHRTALSLGVGQRTSS